MIRQTITRKTLTPAGTLVSETDVFEPALAGEAPAADEPLRRSRQEIVEHVRTSDGAVETMSVRFADPNSPDRLGPLRKSAETTCKGDCQPAMMK
jgi:hypothetical protein